MGAQMSLRHATADRALRVALDATPLLAARTGVGEFCYRLMEGLAARDDVQPSAFAVSWRRRHGLEGQVPPGVAIVGRPMPARPLHQAWSRLPFPPIEAFVGRTDVVHGTNFVVPPARRAAMVVTVHDLTPLHFPEMCEPPTRAFPHLVSQAVARGAWVHALSEFVAAEVVSLLGAPPERVRAVHLGVRAPAAGPEGSWRSLVPDWVRSYVLAVGTVEPRKDFPTLVRAFSDLAPTRPGLALVIAGADGWGTSQLEQALAASPYGDRALRLGRVDDATRDQLIAGATVLAYPSIYEGFGLPPLEAMAAGTPVVATRCGALEEVLGDAALLVGVGDAGELAAALGQLLDDDEARHALAERGRRRAALYSWADCAEGLAQIYRAATS
jgi:glycosyltransferase involved in cell wall biosynthesis